MLMSLATIVAIVSDGGLDSFSHGFEFFCGKEIPSLNKRKFISSFWQQGQVQVLNSMMTVISKMGVLMVQFSFLFLTMIVQEKRFA